MNRIRRRSNEISPRACSRPRGWSAAWLLGLAACSSSTPGPGPAPTEAPITSTPPGDGRRAPADAPPNETPASPSSCDPTVAPFDPATLRASVSYLASPELGGRVPGSAGDRAARAFIEERFRCFGLTPGGEGGSFQVPFVNEGGDATANVVGILAGTDPTVGSEVIVVGAHHDHFGNRGGQGLRLGANDNASGVAGLLAVAQAIAQAPTRPRRTVAFVAFGSEETAAKAPYTEGSATFVAKAPAGLTAEKTVYVVNFDMIGTYTEENIVYALGTVAQTPARAIMADLRTSANAADLRIGVGEPGEEGGSDFYPFCVQGIPYVFFWTPDDTCYHQSCDTADRLDYAQMSQIARIGSDLAGTLASATTDLGGFRRGARVADLGCTDE